MDDLSEKEQLEKMAAWWSENGKYVVGGIVLGAGLLFGIDRYQNSKLQAQLDASSAYETLVGQVVDGDLEDAEVTANTITMEFPDTSYAGQAGLAMARLYMDKNRDQDAADSLTAVIDGSVSDELKHVARLRLARILMYQEKPEEVIDLLEAQDIEAFAASYNEVLGDAYAALGRIEDANQAYQAALLDPLSQGTVDQQLVQWKALDLPAIAENEEIATEDEPDSAEAVQSPESGGEEVE